MKRLFTILAVAFFLSASAETASALGRRGHGCGGCESVGCAPSAPSAPCASSAPQYMTVQRTVRTMVPVVSEQEITELVSVPKPREEERERVVYYPVTREEVRKYYVTRTECVEQEFQRMVSVPVVKNVSREVIVRTPEMRQVASKQIVCTYKDVVENYVRRVCTYERVPVQQTCVDPCNPCNTYVKTCYQCVPVWKEVPYSVARRVAVPVEQEVMVNVCTYREERKTVQVQECSYETQVQKYKALVPTTRTVEESMKVLVCATESKKEKYTARWTEYTTEERKRKVQVTTYKCVDTVVTETVPCGGYPHGCGGCY